jgi:hypothetical protein
LVPKVEPAKFAHGQICREETSSSGGTIQIVA